LILYVRGSALTRDLAQWKEHEDIPLSSLTDDLKRKVAFAARLIEGIDEQMRRLSKHYI
jgi:hypothetical protein